VLRPVTRDTRENEGKITKISGNLVNNWISIVFLIMRFLELLYRFFTFCWQCISLQILVNNQPDALFHVLIYSFILSTRFEHQVLIIRRSNCITTSSGMISLCYCLVCRSGIPSSHLHRLIIPDDVVIQFDLLMMSTWCSKRVERLNE